MRLYVEFGTSYSALTLGKSQSALPKSGVTVLPLVPIASKVTCRRRQVALLFHAHFCQPMPKNGVVTHVTNSTRLLAPNNPAALDLVWGRRLFAKRISQGIGDPDAGMVGAFGPSS